LLTSLQLECCKGGQMGKPLRERPLARQNEMGRA
jgi:hypothetical protein